MTGDVSRDSLSLRAARTDGATALLATGNELALDAVSPYSGVTDRRGTFPSMQPAWRNASASPDGSWVLWTRDGESWTVLDTRHAESVELPSTRFRSTLLKWAPDGQSFIALDTTACTLAVVVPAASRQDELASFGDLCQNQDFYVEAWWSPDGSRIAYVLYPPVSTLTTLRTGEIHTIKPDGTDHHTIDPVADTCRIGAVGNEHVRALPWSPDGSRVAYVTAPFGGSAPGGTVQFRTAAADGSDSVLLLEVPLSDYANPSSAFPICEWSPGGNRLLVQALQGVYSVGARGEELHALSAPATSQGFSWSPDGTHLGLLEIVESSRVLETMRYDGSERRQVFTTDPVDLGGAWIWSKDGTHGAYVLRDSNGGFELHIDDIANGQDVIVRDATDRYTWIPDGSRVLYQTPPSADASTRVVSVLPDGSDEKVLSVPEDSVPELVWLAGGQYWAGADRDGIWIEKFGTSERFAFQAKGSGETFLDFAPWDHDSVWRYGLSY